MNRLSNTKRAQIVAALVEGMSIRAVCRLTGRSKNTVARLLVELGEACRAYHDEAFRGIKAKSLQCDEIWAFCYAKAKNVPEDKKGQWGYGDVWTWTCIDADSKLMVSWMVGRRDAQHAWFFMQDVASRVDGRAQVTTDGFTGYVWAVPAAFEGQVDFAQLVKIYGQGPAEEGRYSPPVCLGCKKHVRVGDPDEDQISTSYVERSNLTLRMSQRRWTRLTNAFSKKVENLQAAVDVHFTYYNLCRPHQTLGGKTPAQAAGIADRRWTVADLVGLLERREVEGTPN